MPDSTPANREPARSDGEAKKRFHGVLNRSLSTVHRAATWIVAPSLQGDRFNAITVPDVIALNTSGDGPRLFLRSTIQFTFEDNKAYAGERKASTVLYAHTVGAAESLKPQLYSWEWSSVEPVHPHVHVRRGDPDFHGLGKLHIPTGRVFYEHILIFLIAEHDVKTCRADWKAVLDDGFQRVSSYATWGGGNAGPR